jgi:hypothetical protein
MSGCRRVVDRNACNDPGSSSDRDRCAALDISLRAADAFAERPCTCARAKSGSSRRAALRGERALIPRRQRARASSSAGDRSDPFDGLVDAIGIDRELAAGTGSGLVDQTGVAEAASICRGSGLPLAVAHTTVGELIASGADIRPIEAM